MDEPDLASLWMKLCQGEMSFFDDSLWIFCVISLGGEVPTKSWEWNKG